MPKAADFDVSRGSFAGIAPLTKRGREWLKRNASYEPWQVQGGFVVMEPRQCADIMAAIRAAGMLLKGEN